MVLSSQKLGIKLPVTLFHGYPTLRSNLSVMIAALGENTSKALLHMACTTISQWTLALVHVWY